jgi:hypothetical protein
VPASNVEGSRDHVADLYLLYSVADFYDLPDVLVPEDPAFRDVGPAFLHVQV